MKVQFAVLLAATLFGATCEASAQQRNAQAAATQVSPLPPGTETRPIAFTKMVVSVGRGETVGTSAFGLLCMPPRGISRSEGRADVSDERFDGLFSEVMTSAGFRVEGDPADLFAERNASSSEYAVAGNITGMQMKICYPLGSFGDMSTFNGNASMDVEWQIFSRIEQKVIAKIRTSGAFIQGRNATGSSTMLLEQAFAENVRKLSNVPEFRAAFVGAARPAADRVAAPKQDVLTISNPKPATAPPISDAVGSVVALFTGDGHGSGFLISPDGHLLTNYHVVGEAKFVKVRWSDGLETLGEVVRRDKRRDVALVKTDGRGRQPLALRLESTQPGEEVYAIGTPVDPRFQSTVTRGIVSANRVMEGFTFLQSDVTVNPGNSGGPLLDRESRVMAITVSVIRDEGRPTNINLFIPIRDALDFLALKIQ